MMKVSTMHLADRWLGWPACVALTLVRRARDAFRRDRTADPGPIRRIAFVKLSEQGATVLAWPALRRAIEMVGRENVYFVCFEENRFILDVMDLIPRGNVITIRSRKLIDTVLQAMSAIRRLRSLRIDAALDMEFFARSSAALCYLSGARRRVGYHAFVRGPRRGDLMTHRLIYNPTLHVAQQFRMQVEALTLPGRDLPTFDMPALPADEMPPPLDPPAAELEEVRAILADASGSDRFEPLVLLNANCSDLMPLRRWPDERYVELARRLLDHDPDLHVAFTGAPSEADAVVKLVKQVGSHRCFNLAGRTTLPQLLLVYMLADVLVTNDSGPAHFATLTPIDVITLFGPVHPQEWAARSPRNHVIWENLPCSPCVSPLTDRVVSPCRNNVCMQRITVERVADQVRRLLDARTETERASPEVTVTVNRAGRPT